MDFTNILFIVAILIIVIWALSLYNSLIRKRNQVDNVFASLDAILKKRYDLIPNLVAIVQSYMKYENETLTKITELRSRALSGRISYFEKVELNNEMSDLLRSIQFSVENYPDLKANANFAHLQSSLNEVEEQISAGRRSYNSMVTEFNTSIQVFPANILASIMNFDKRPLFTIADYERQNVNVKGLMDN